MAMDFSSLRMRKTGDRSNNGMENRKKTFSISNISFTSGNSTNTTCTVIRKSLSITLPRDLGIQQDVDGRVVKVCKTGSAHLSGVIQVGDLVNVFPNDLPELRLSPGDECPLNMHDDEFVNVNIIYGILQVDSRPLCPLMVEIGNRNNTSLGLALADSPGEKIRISSIQPGSLAERCGYLKPGDILISIQIRENETISCSPYYTSYETAQIIRSITSSVPTVALTILPYEAEQLQLQKQHISLFNMLSSTAAPGSSNKMKHKKEFGSESTLIPDCGGQNENNTCNGKVNDFRDDLDEDDDNINGHGDHGHEIEGDEEEEDHNNHEDHVHATGALGNYSILSFSLWKDRLYEDWGFSLTDSSLKSQQDSQQNTKTKKCDCVIKTTGGASRSSNSKPSDSGSSASAGNSRGYCEHEDLTGKGSEILQIRPGGPAFAAGLQPGDRIMQINRQDVSHLESTMLVPILASLDDSLNLTVIRLSGKTTKS